MERSMMVYTVCAFPSIFYNMNAIKHLIFVQTPGGHSHFGGYAQPLFAAWKTSKDIKAGTQITVKPV